MDTIITTGALAIAALIFALDRFGYLPKRKTASDAAGELEIADRKIERLEAQVVELRAQKVDLIESALQPVVEQLGHNAQLQAQVLDRLIHHNGSFRHMEEALGEVREGLRLLTGFIAGVVELPLKPPREQEHTR